MIKEKNKVIKPYRNIRNDLGKVFKVKNNSYYLEKQIKGKILRKVIGKVNEISKDKAVNVAIDLISKAREFGVESVTGVGATATLNQSKKLTLRQVIDEFINQATTTGTKKSKGRPFREGSVRSLKMQTRNHWDKIVDLPIASIDYLVCEEWYRSIKDKQAKEKATHIAYESLRKLNRIFNYAFSLGYILNNPFDRITKSEQAVKPDNVRNEDDVRLSLDKDNDLGKFVSAIAEYKPVTNKKNYYTVRDLLATYLLTGARKNELRNITWSMVDTEHFQYFESSADITKTRKKYYYPLCKMLSELFRKRYENRHHLARVLKGKASLKYVFPNDRGTGAIVDVRWSLQNILQKAGITKAIGFHSFRYTFAEICKALTKDSEGNDIQPTTRYEALHHQATTTTDKIYATSISADKLHSLFQAVEDFVSQSMVIEIKHIEGSWAVFSGLEIRGAEGKKQSTRISKEADFREVYFGRKLLRDIPFENAGFVKDTLDYYKSKYADTPEDYPLTTVKDMIAMVQNCIKEFKNLNALTERARPYHKDKKANWQKLINYRKQWNTIKKHLLADTEKTLNYLYAEEIAVTDNGIRLKQLIKDIDWLKVQWTSKDKVVKTHEKNILALQSNIKAMKRINHLLTTTSNPILKTYYEKINKEKNNVVINLNKNNKNKLREVESK